MRPPLVSVSVHGACPLGAVPPAAWTAWGAYLYGSWGPRLPELEASPRFLAVSVPFKIKRHVARCAKVPEIDLRLDDLFDRRGRSNSVGSTFGSWNPIGTATYRHLRGAKRVLSSM